MLNMDASFLVLGARYDFVLWNHEGKVLKSSVRPLHDIYSTEHVEVIAT